MSTGPGPAAKLWRAPSVPSPFPRNTATVSENRSATITSRRPSLFTSAVSTPAAPLEKVVS
jgi:hypothetical protein